MFLFPKLRKDAENGCKIVRERISKIFHKEVLKYLLTTSRNPTYRTMKGGINWLKCNTNTFQVQILQQK